MLACLRLRRRLGLEVESLHVSSAGEPAGDDHLHGHDAPQRFLAGLVHNPHAAARDFLQQLIISHVADLAARSHGPRQGVAKTANRFGQLVQTVALHRKTAVARAVNSG